MKEGENMKNLDIIAFVNSIILASTEGREPITENEAEYNIREWKKEGIEIPDGMTGKVFAMLLNVGI